MVDMSVFLSRRFSVRLAHLLLTCIRGPQADVLAL